MKNRLYALLFLLLPASPAFAADLPALGALFKSNFNRFYQPRYCGKNTAKLVLEASMNKINLSNSYVLKITGAGFWETSAFYTREQKNERVMIGYYHVVLVADGYVFDFDLNEPLILKLEDYFRLQFTPPGKSFYIYGNEYNARSQLEYWTATAFAAGDYIKGKETMLWQKKLGEYINLDRLFNKPRMR